MVVDADIFVAVCDSDVCVCMFAGRFIHDILHPALKSLQKRWDDKYWKLWPNSELRTESVSHKLIFYIFAVLYIYTSFCFWYNIILVWFGLKQTRGTYNRSLSKRERRWCGWFSGQEKKVWREGSWLSYSEEQKWTRTTFCWPG